jgi:hypothetical protein
MNHALCLESTSQSKDTLPDPSLSQQNYNQENPHDSLIFEFSFVRLLSLFPKKIFPDAGTGGSVLS